MSEQGFQFRTALFGGFRKEDVLAYLEQSAKTNTERINALRRDLSQAEAASAEDQQHSSTLSDEVAKLRAENQRLAAELAAALERKGELEMLKTQLESELETARPSAEAYEAIKSRTAGIELEAHGRAQAIEDEARRKAIEFQEQVKRWFEKVCLAYERMRGDLNATMNHAVREMSRIHQNFEDISGDLSGYDKAMAEMQKVMEAWESEKIAQSTEDKPE